MQQLTHISGAPVVDRLALTGSPFSHMRWEREVQMIKIGAAEPKESQR